MYAAMQESQKQHTMNAESQMKAAMKDSLKAAGSVGNESQFVVVAALLCDCATV